MYIISGYHNIITTSDIHHYIVGCYQGRVRDGLSGGRQPHADVDTRFRVTQSTMYPHPQPLDVLCIW